MKFQVGDEIYLIKTEELGFIVDFINEKMVLVEVGSTQFPAFMDEIDFPYFKRFSAPKNSTHSVAKKSFEELSEAIKKNEFLAPATASNPVGMWLSFVPLFGVNEWEEAFIHSFKLLLVNYTEDAVKFLYRFSHTNESIFELENTVLPTQSFYLHDVRFVSMQEQVFFQFDFSIEKNKKSNRFEAVYKPKSKKFFQQFEQLILQQEGSFSHLLYTAPPIAVQGENYDFYPPQKLPNFVDPKRVYRATKEKIKEVIDLHIEAIPSKTPRPAKFEILPIQLNYFEKHYELAVLHQLKKLTVIHGVGEGILKNAIHEILIHKKEVKNFVHQYHPLYGFGATEIYFK